MFCMHCGKQIDDTAAFCSYCGGKLKQSPQQGYQQPPQQHPSRLVYPEQKQTANKQVRTRKQRNALTPTIFIILGCVVLVIVIIAVINSVSSPAREPALQSENGYSPNEPVLAAPRADTNTSSQVVNPADDFEYSVISGGIEIVKYVGNSETVQIPEEIDGMAVISIGEKAFYRDGYEHERKPFINEVVIPKNVTSIGYWAFSGNRDLEDVTIEANEYSIGNLIRFGGHFWRVLDVNDGKALVISEDVIATRDFHKTSTEDVSWAGSDIREYLNNEFYYNFTPEDRNRIIGTTVVTQNNPVYGNYGGPDTVDYVFLLSIDEAERYFSNDSERVAYNNCAMNLEYLGGAAWWWLRSPGQFGGQGGRANHAAYIMGDGQISYNGVGFDGYGNLTTGGIRPALWLDLG